MLEQSLLDAVAYRLRRARYALRQKMAEFRPDWEEGLAEGLAERVRANPLDTERAVKAVVWLGLPRETAERIARENGLGRNMPRVQFEFEGFSQAHAREFAREMHPDLVIEAEDCAGGRVVLEGRRG